MSIDGFHFIQIVSQRELYRLVELVVDRTFYTKPDSVPWSENTSRKSVQTF